MSGLFLSALGLYVLCGWLLQRIDIIEIRPGWMGMFFNTALCFVLCGLSLLLTPLRQYRLVSSLRSLLLVGVVLLATAELVEIIFGLNLGIDQAEMHRKLQPNVLYPGRMGPNTALTFLLFGLAALLHLHTRQPLFKNVMRWLTLVVFLLGVLGVAGYFLDLPNLYPDFFLRIGVSGVLLVVASGSVILAVGLWGFWYSDYLRGLINDDIDVARIYHTTVFVVCMLGLATGIAGFAFLQSALKTENSSSLLRLQSERANYFQTVLDRSIQTALIASNSPTVRDIFQKLHANPDDRAAFELLHKRSQGFIAAGFLSIAAEINGRPYAQLGQPMGDQVFGIALSGPDPAELIWHEGYYLRMRYPVRNPDTGVIYGHMLTEQPLRALDQSQADALRWGETGEMGICGAPVAGTIKCFPSRHWPQAREGGNTELRGRLLPMVYALRNETGVKISEDYRGRPVIAAHGPIGKTGLGLVVKMDLAEIYAPIRQRLELAVPAIIGLMLLGLWLIHVRVRPLVQKQVSMRAAAEKERSYFVTAAESSPDAFFILESCKDHGGEIVDFRFSYLNQKVRHAFPNVTEDMTGTSFLAQFPHRLNFFGKYKKVAETGVMLDEEFSWTMRGQSAQWINLQAVQMENGVAVTWRDLTRKRNSERLLDESNRLRKTIVETAPYAIISSDSKGLIRTFNQAAERMLGYEASEIIGQKTVPIFHDADEIASVAEALSKELGTPIKPGPGVFIAKAKLGLIDEREWTYIRKDGGRVPVRLSITAIRDSDEKITGYLGVAHDISEQKRTAAYMRHVALHDVLTGLPNRALLDDRIHQAINGTQRTGRSFALVLLDIDRFKQINDTLGHHIGDQVLVEFVERVKTCMRPGDTFARMGGDEFVMVFPGCGADDVSLILRRVQASLVPPMHFAGRDLHVTSSMGVSIAPEHGQDQITLMHQADVAMYQVKQQGRNGLKIFSPELVDVVILD